jgi:hypothetical protein
MVGLHIGRTAGASTDILRTHGLAPLRHILSPEAFQQAFSVKPAPKRILVPEVVFWLMATVALGAGSMVACISEFWASLRASISWLPSTPVTEEAFCTARRKLPLRFFLRLFAGILRRLPARPHLRWKGLRPLGIDGSDVDLPRHPHLRKVFPPAGNQHGSLGPPQARLVGLVGLWDGVCYDFRWTSLKVGEQESARRLLRGLGPGDLLLCDRNFPDKATLAGVLAQKADFLFHLPSNRFLKLARTGTPSGRPDEWYTQLTLPAELRAQFRQLGPEIAVRILQYQRRGFRPSWLITSLLDTGRFPYQEVVQLYHERWRHETFHREWKHTLQLANLRSLTAGGLLKEVLVQLTLNNAIRWIMAEAAPPPLRPVDLKFLEAKRLILAAVPVMTVAPVVQLPLLYRQLVDSIGRRRILVRPGRSYPRRWDARGRPKGHGKVAAPAKLSTIKEQSNASI